jgi:L-lysine exporter family protein LysE/ArgO
VPVTTGLLAALAGLSMGLSLIVAIGAQNAFVLREGLRGRYVTPIVAVCVVSDALLIAAGVAGAGAVLDRRPWLLTGVRIAGAAFLFGYGVLAARRAVTGGTLRPNGTATDAGLRSTIAVGLALTWLNPHVYLDTVVLLGSIAATHGDRRWWFAAGAATASLGWFLALGYGAALLRPLFARPSAWRVLDAGIAAVMTSLAIALLVTA